MTLKTQLQSIADKIYTKFGTNEGDLVIRKQARASGVSSKLQPYASVTNTDVRLTDGFSVQRVSHYRVKEGGMLQSGDVIFKIPADQLTEAQLTGCQLIYPASNPVISTNSRYKVVSHRPNQIINGGPVLWEIVARKES